MNKEENNSVQEWLPYEEILENGIIKLKNNSFIKIIKLNTINFNLKTDLEKEAILNSYKIFLKTCNFNFQILIQSNKEDLSKHISNIQKQFNQEKDKIKELSTKYIEYINGLNNDKKSSSKNFYIIVKKQGSEEIEDWEVNASQELNDKYFKIKECLSRCGNIVTDVSKKTDVEKILFSFLNTRIYFKSE